MKLIDADALHTKVSNWKHQQRSTNSDYFTGYVCALSTVEGMIAEAQTIDAIPVEWLQKKRKYASEGDSLDVGIAEVLDIWEKEHEART